MVLSDPTTVKTVLFFGREAEKVLLDVIPDMLYGRYSEGGILFVSKNQIVTFYTAQGSEYRKRVLNKGEEMVIWDPEKISFDFLLLPIDAEETRKIYDTCEACAKVNKPFNLKDMVLIHVPFRQPKELSVIDAQTLNNPQAIILILRECLNVENPLRRGLEGLNSRQTFLSVLHEILSQHALPVTWERIVDLHKDPN